MLIKPQISNSCSPIIPDVNVYLPSLPVSYIVVFSVLGVCALVTLLLYIEVVVFFSRRLKDWKPKYRARFILAVYPAMGCAAYVSLLIPRSSGLNDLVSATYVSLCVYIFMAMLVGHYGGPKKMMSRLTTSKIEFSVPPLCCCLRCLPRVDVTSTRLRILRFLVLQYAVIRPLLGYIIAVMWSEMSYGKSKPMRAPTTYINLIYAISTLTATWGLAMFYRLSVTPLQFAAITPKFVCFQLIVIISGIQRPLFTILVITGAMPCESPLSAEATADRWNHMFVVGEMMILMIVARYFYRREVSEPAAPKPEILIDNEAPMSTRTPRTSLADDAELKIGINNNNNMADKLQPVTPPRLYGSIPTNGDFVVGGDRSKSSIGGAPAAAAVDAYPDWVKFDDVIDDDDDDGDAEDILMDAFGAVNDEDFELDVIQSSSSTSINHVEGSSFQTSSAAVCAAVQPGEPRYPPISLLDCTRKHRQQPELEGESRLQQYGVGDLRGMDEENAAEPGRRLTVSGCGDAAAPSAGSVVKIIEDATDDCDVSES